MRFLLKATIPVNAGNAAARAGKLGGTIQAILADLKPEGVYFTDDHGQRTAFIVLHMQDASQIPAMAEPWFLAFNASEVSADDLCWWPASQGRDPSPGRGHRPPAPAGAGPPGHRGPSPRWAPGRTAPRAVAHLLAARAPPALGVPGPTPADAPVGDDAPAALHARVAPERPLSRRLQPHAAPCLRYPSGGAGGRCASSKPSSGPIASGPPPAPRLSHLKPSTSCLRLSPP
jgi:hypothetical protein